MPLLVCCRFVVRQRLSIVTWVVERVAQKGRNPSMMVRNLHPAGACVREKGLPDLIPGIAPACIVQFLDKAPGKVKDIEILVGGKTRRQRHIDQVRIGQSPRSHALE